MLERRLREALAGSPLAEKFPTYAESFLELRSKDPGADRLEGPALQGLARVLASSADAARFLTRRPLILERLAYAGPDTLAERGEQLLADTDPGSDDLETSLDSLRLLRRDETMFAACLDLGGLVPFAQVSWFLSCLAESIVGRAYRLARRQVGAPPTRTDGSGLGIVGMGKIAGREMTYHSDLDLIFLTPDEGPLSAPEASRVAQRLIGYLNTMTGAGVAYAVDSRLRPSGRQGTLLSTFRAYERYQRRDAATWEHLALVRSRAIAGDVAPTRAVLDRVCDAVLGDGRARWSEVGAMRARVQNERTRGSRRIDFKTGRGGIMEVDFLAAGALLERGAATRPTPLPSIPAMLRAIGQSPRLEQLAEDHAYLRRVEARARWAADRAVDRFSREGQTFEVLAELVEPGLDPEQLAYRVSEVRERNRAAYEAVIAAGTIDVLLEG
jgi:glutamate-ammonia-ligase adenylyltransferase